MKKILIYVLSLALSICTLTACTNDNSNQSGVNFNDTSSSSSGSPENDIPTNQTDPSKKFTDMYDISEDGKSITVISQEFLENFWKNNYVKEEIHSLTTEEVNYIIKDSIRVYSDYDKVILAGFVPDSSDTNVAERFPYVEGQEICKSTDSGLQSNKAKSDIYKIISYRLKALSSPKAFFTGEEAIRFVGDLPGIYSTMLPFASIYIPGYSANTDRDYIISVIGNSAKSNSQKIDTERYSDLFIMWEKSGEYIAFEPKAESKQQTKLFPTE